MHTFGKHIGSWQMDVHMGLSRIGWQFIEWVSQIGLNRLRKSCRTAPLRNKSYNGIKMRSGYQRETEEPFWTISLTRVAILVAKNNKPSASTTFHLVRRLEEKVITMFLLPPPVKKHERRKYSTYINTYVGTPTTTNPFIFHDMEWSRNPNMGDNRQLL